MENDKRNIFSTLKDFPSMPSAASELLSIIDEPKVTAFQIEDVLRYDPGLTANILKLSNSAYFGLSNEIGSVKKAVVLLGLKKLTQIVMTSCVNALMGRVEVQGLISILNKPGLPKGLPSAARIKMSSWR